MGAMTKSIHTPEYRFFRSQLRSIREGAGITQRALAARLKVPHSWVAKVECGERRMDLVEFYQFVSGCGGDPVVEADRLLREIVKRRTRHSTKKGDE